MNYYKEIIDVISKNGVFIEYTPNEPDIDLRDYITDSLQFIGFIIAIEEKFGIEISDKYLLYDSIASIYSFSEIVKDCITS